MVSRRFACLLLAVSMTLSSIWIVSADQSHQIQDAAEAAASYFRRRPGAGGRGPVPVRPGQFQHRHRPGDAGAGGDRGPVPAGRSGSAAAAGGGARQAEAARQAARTPPAAPAARPPARPCWMPMTAPWPPVRSPYTPPPVTALPLCGPCARARWPGSTTSPRTAIGIRSPSAAPPAMSGPTRARPCSTAIMPAPPP